MIEQEDEVRLIDRAKNVVHKESSQQRGSNDDDLIPIKTIQSINIQCIPKTG